MEILCIENDDLYVLVLVDQDFFYYATSASHTPRKNQSDDIARG